MKIVSDRFLTCLAPAKNLNKFISDDQSHSIQSESESEDSVHSLRSSHLGHHHDKDSEHNSNNEVKIPQSTHSPEEQS